MNSRREPSGPALRAGHDPLGHVAAEHAKPADRLPWGHFLVFLVGAALVVIAMWYHIDGQHRASLARWRGQISEIASDRARLVENWLDSRRADAEVLAASPSVRVLLSGAARGDEELGRHLRRVVSAYGYASISIFDTQGRTMASSGAARRGADTGNLAAEVAEARKVRVDLTEKAAEGWLLTLSVPVFVDGGAGPRVLGVVTLRMKPEAGLFPLLAGETTTRSGETLLLRLDAQNPTYLSPLRHPPAGWAALNRSLEGFRGLAEGATEGRTGFGELTDYRAIPVLAAVRLIPSTGWALALKVDRDEALTDFYRSGQLAGAAAAFLLLALAGFLISFWRQKQRTNLANAQMEQERAISNLKGYAEKIVASVPSGLLLLSADLHILSVNRSFLDSFRLEEDDVLGHRLQDIVRAEGLIRRAEAVLQSGIPQRDIVFDLHLIPHQDTRPVLITMTGIRMAGDQPARLLLILQDLTEEERLQAARRASEERFRDLVQGLDAIVWEADAASLRFSFVSQRAQIILGYPVERWLGSSDFFQTRIHPDDRARTLELCREAIAQGVDHELEYRALTAAGREIWLRDIVHVLSGGDGGPAQLRGLTVDVTERKRSEEALRQTEEQLRQAQKMDAVGKLAGGIAHDFNNLLMVIRGDADLILRRLPPDNPLRQNTQGICEAADQAATLTRQLLAFSRKQVLAPAVLDLNAVVAGIQKMLRRLIGETINLVTVTAPDLRRIKADPGQLEQMILNLAVNARDAMPDGGRLTIRTSNTELDAGMARQRGVKLGTYVTLEVSDTGVGMDAETQAHLFEPFFTTKDQGKGTGLGLSTVYGIVKQSGGHIWVESAPGRGTTLRMYLPSVDEEAELASAPRVLPAEKLAPLDGQESEAMAVPAATPSPRRETILLVEDAARVREVVREILEMNGYEVLEADHGAEALKISSRHQGPIDLVVTDVVMPQMSGRELAQRLASLRPETRVLYMSGYTDDDIVKHGVLGADMAFISKPFTPDALAAKVRELLDASGKSATKHPGAAARPARATV